MTTIEAHCPTHGVIYEPRCHYCREYTQRASRRQGFGWKADEIAAMIRDDDALRAEVARLKTHLDEAQRDHVEAVQQGLDLAADNKRLRNAFREELARAEILGEDARAEWIRGVLGNDQAK